MKTFEINIFTIITLFQLTPSLQEACGVARVIQVSNETGSSPQTHFPWAGALYSVVNKTMAGDMKYICGATLVSESFSVTAGHCIYDKHSEGYRRAPSHIISYFGIYDLKQRNTTGWEFEKIFVHEDWNPLDESFDADIALLKLRKLIAFTDIIKPICLWPSDEDEFLRGGTVISWTEPEAEDPGFWNHEHDLLHNFPQQYLMPIRSNAECFLEQPRFKTIAGERSFCAGGLNSGPCLELGTSGASMAVQMEEKFYLRGIVSASFIDIAGCDNVTFTLFSDVLKFKAWIIDITEASQNVRQ